MSDRLDSRLVLAFALGAFGFVLLLATVSDCGNIQRAAAQAPATPDDVTLLARTAVREAGTRAHLRDDTSAIHAVISFRAEHIYRSSYAEAVLRATNHAPLRRASPRPWITELVHGGPRPSLFPGYLRWEGRHAPWWRATYLHAREVYRGDIGHDCRVPGEEDDVGLTPHDWGSEHDAVRFRREHPEAVELDCGQTCTLEPDGRIRLTRDGLPRCNHWFHFPRYEARFGET